MRDTGVGIPSEFLPHVFDRFRQADASSTRAHGGLGLGLAIVRHVVELHGGSVEVASEGEGKGATFSVRLPLMPVSGAQASPSPGTAASSAVSLAGVSVLVVDDDLDSRELVSISLARCGAEVRSVSSAQAALDAVAEKLPDVLLSDIEMPGMDGYALIKRIRALPPERGGRVPAAALTAYARSEDKLNALQRGFQMHLAKPIEPAELATVVASLARRAAGPPAVS